MAAARSRIRGGLSSIRDSVVLWRAVAGLPLRSISAVVLIGELSIRGVEACVKLCVLLAGFVQLAGFIHRQLIREMKTSSAEA